MIDEQRALEPEVLGPPEIGAHVGKARRLRAERETRKPQPEAHQCPPPPTAVPLTTSAMRPAGRAFQLRPTNGKPSTRIVEMPGRSPFARASSAVDPTDPTGASQMTRSAALPGVIVPVSSPWTRAVFPVANATTLSGATSPSDARWAMSRRMPRGTTPVPD